MFTVEKVDERTVARYFLVNPADVRKWVRLGFIVPESQPKKKGRGKQSRMWFRPQDVKEMLGRIEEQAIRGCWKGREMQGVALDGSVELLDPMAVPDGPVRDSLVRGYWKVAQGWVMIRGLLESHGLPNGSGPAEAAAWLAAQFHEAVERKSSDAALVTKIDELVEALLGRDEALVDFGELEPVVQAKVPVDTDPGVPETGRFTGVDCCRALPAYSPPQTYERLQFPGGSPPDGYVGVLEIMEGTGIRRERITKALRSGELPGVKVGDCRTSPWVVLKEDAEHFIAKCGNGNGKVHVVHVGA